MHANGSTAHNELVPLDAGGDTEPATNTKETPATIVGMKHKAKETGGSSKCF